MSTLINSDELNKTISSIDTLVKMSGSREDSSSLNIELERIEKELANTRADIESLRGLMSPERYYDANNAIVNNAIETSLVRRNQSLNFEIADRRSQVESLEAEKAELETRMASNEANIARAQRCIETLSARVNENTSLDETTANNYDSLVAKSKQSLEVFNQEGENLATKIAELTTKIQALEAEIAALNTDIQTNNDYLEANRKSASETNQDSLLKTHDEKEISRLETRIADLEAQRRTILDNPVLIASQAKKALLEDNDITLALTNIRKLVDIVSSQAYMNIPYSDTFADEMASLLKSAEEERDTFKASIADKDYNANSPELDETRKSYLESRIAFYNDSIAKIREIVSSLDSQNSLNSSTNIAQIDTKIAQMQDTIASYTATADLKLSEAEIKSATARKEAQIADANELLASYQLDAINDAGLASSLERQTISLFEQAIASAKEELETIESRLNIQRVKHEDTAARSIDASKLKELEKHVIDIKNRTRYKQSPSQILEDIEASLGTNIEPTVAESPDKTYDLDESENRTISADGLKIDHIIDLARDAEPAAPELTDAAPKEDSTFVPVTPIYEPVAETPEENDYPTFVPPTIPQFEPFSLDSYEPPKESEPEVPGRRFHEDETPRIVNDETLPTRGSKVVDVIPITLESPKEEIANEDLSTEKVQEPATLETTQEPANSEPVVSQPEPANPFQSTSGSNIFDFNGSLLDDTADENLDFFQAADNIGLGLGKAA